MKKTAKVLEAVIIPAGVTNIGTAAFFNCKRLESIVIPAGITSIAELTFCGCKNLTNISIKKSVIYVAKKAFDGCTSLALVDYKGTKQEWEKIIIKSGNDPFTFYVNGKAVTPDENGCIRIVVDQYLLIGALSIPAPAPDVEESLNIFQQLIKSIKDFFAKLTSIFKF